MFQDYEPSSDGAKRQKLELSTPNDECPDIFVVVILSHGDKNGLILTDQLAKPEKNLSEVETEHFYSFTTEQAFDSLKKNDLIKNSLKLVFLGVSRINSQKLLSYL